METTDRSFLDSDQINLWSGAMSPQFADVFVKRLLGLDFIRLMHPLRKCPNVMTVFKERA